jgi:hypothetical protein
MMNTLKAILIVSVLIAPGLCYAQASHDTTARSEIYQMLDHIRDIMQGAPYEQVKQYASREGMVIGAGDSTLSLLNVLKRKDRLSILREDSTRQGVQVIAKSNEAENAIYVLLKTDNAKKGDPRWHSLVLYKEPENKWHIYMWHVGR